VSDNPSAQAPGKTGWRDWLLIAIGAGAVLAPDLSSFDILLARLNLGWILHGIHTLGGIMLLSASWARLKRWLPTSMLWNRVLLAVGLLDILSPDLTGLADWLSSLHVGWLTHVAHGLGGAALLAANWNRIIGTLTEQVPEKQRIIS
jgi:hypothetical protein